MSEEELRKQLRSNDSLKKVARKYKDLASATTVVTEWKHDTILVKVPVYIDHDTIVPLSDSCFTANLSVSDGLLSLTDMSIINKQDIVTGARKNGLFKAEYSFDIINSNPCIEITGMKSYKVVHKKKFYESPFFLIPVGMIGGVIIHNQFTK